VLKHVVNDNKQRNDRRQGIDPHLVLCACADQDPTAESDPDVGEKQLGDSEFGLPLPAFGWAPASVGDEEDADCNAHELGRRDADRVSIGMPAPRWQSMFIR
jgi:hypothetical protein